MQGDFLSLMDESQTLNSRLFSLVRLKLLGSLCVVGPDGATYRELKASLHVSDGVLYSNLNILKNMEYLESEKIEFEGKELELYMITPEGTEEWCRIKAWLCDFLQCGGVADE